MRQMIIAGNWKMNTDLESGHHLIAGVRGRIDELDVPADLPVVVCPPFVHLTMVATEIADSVIRLGAQNAFHEPAGAYTGEVSAPMLRSAGCEFVIVGHSERRERYMLTDMDVALSAQAVLHAGMRPIICIGETLEEREGNRVQGVLHRQLDAAIDGVMDIAECVIAYEPVWAIGTGRSATVEQISHAHAMIRERVYNRESPGLAASIPILYGGSLNAHNAREILALEDVDGGLLGGASLHATEFTTIVELAIAEVARRADRD